MAFHTILLLFCAGAAGSMISSLVGGAAVVTYPALIAAGISPLLATACNITALIPGMFLAVLSDRTQLPKIDRSFVHMVIASVLAAAVGAVVLMTTPEHVFALLVPILLGFATILFAFSRQVSDWIRARAQARGRDIEFSVTSLKILLPVSFYGGYFGAGVGLLILGVMSVATQGDYRRANVTKNLVTCLNSCAASSIYVWYGKVIWPQTIGMAAGTLVGGIAGAWLARIMPREAMRVTVVAVSILLTIYFAWRYWF